MSKGQSGTKTAGKIFAAICIILLIAVLSASWFIGGQTRAVQKYFTARASGSYSDYVSLLIGSDYDECAADEYKSESRAFFTSLAQFEKLEENDTIGTNVKVKEHRINGAADKWICTADIDFYSNGMSVSFKDVEVSLLFSGGKWYFRGTDLSVDKTE